VNDQLHEHTDYISKELDIGQTYDEIRAELQQLQMAGKIPGTEKIPIGHSTKDSTVYEALVDRYKLQDLSKGIGEQLVSRNCPLRAIRARLRNPVLEGLRKNHRAILHGKGSQVHEQASQRIAQSVADDLSTRDDFDVEASGEDTDEVDEDILDQYMIDSREEPECWDE
jgi:hypothetical protein